MPRAVRQADAEELLKEQYPHFLPAWRRLNATVLKGDIIRYFIMDSVGGLYLDMDVECFWRAEPDLRHGNSACQRTLMCPHRHRGVDYGIDALQPRHRET